MTLPSSRLEKMFGKGELQIIIIEETKTLAYLEKKTHWN